LTKCGKYREQENAGRNIVRKKILEYLVILAVTIGFAILALYLSDITSLNAAKPMVNCIHRLIHGRGHDR
jgi:hypothetical protein